MAHKELSMNNIIELKIKPEWENIEKVREKTEQLLESKGFGNDIKDSIIMIISELLENAIKYGKFTEEHCDINTRVTINERNITIEVQSPVSDEDDMHFKRLDRIIQWVRGYQNPFEAYIAKVKEIALQPISDNQSGLGIVRIAYEGQAVIDFYVSDENVISISAVYHLARTRRC